MVGFLGWDIVGAVVRDGDWVVVVVVGVVCVVEGTNTTGKCWTYDCWEAFIAPFLHQLLLNKRLGFFFFLHELGGDMYIYNKNL